jgi:hypothetical protein
MSWLLSSTKQNALEEETLKNNNEESDLIDETRLSSSDSEYSESDEESESDKNEEVEVEVEEVKEEDDKGYSPNYEYFLLKNESLYQSKYAEFPNVGGLKRYPCPCSIDDDTNTISDRWHMIMSDDAYVYAECVECGNSDKNLMTNRMYLNILNNHFKDMSDF